MLWDEGVRERGVSGDSIVASKQGARRLSTLCRQPRREPAITIVPMGWGEVRCELNVKKSGEATAAGMRSTEDKAEHVTRKAGRSLGTNQFELDASLGPRSVSLS